MPDRPLSNLALLRVMVSKEVRTTFRERSQMLGLVVSVVMLFVVVTASLLPALNGMRFQPNRSTSRPSPVATQQMVVPHRSVLHSTVPTHPEIRWIATGLVAGIGFFFSCGYLFAAVLATFVGEKEARTLEILLASPLTDLKLYFVKCVSVLMPSTMLGFAFSTGVSLLLILLLPRGAVGHPVELFSIALIFGMPVLMLLQIWFVGLGAAISVRTETMKGAGQVLGIVLLVLIFGTAYGIPLLLAAMPALYSPVARFVARCSELPFGIQYLLLLVLLSIPAGIFIGVGRLAFRRDRMLT